MIESLPLESDLSAKVLLVEVDLSQVKVRVGMVLSIRYERRHDEGHGSIISWIWRPAAASTPSMDSRTPCGLQPELRPLSYAWWAWDLDAISALGLGDFGEGGDLNP